MKGSFRGSAVRAAAFLLIVAGVVYCWQSLWQEYPKARAGLYSRRIDSYLPDLAALRPELLRNGREGARFLAYYHLIEREVPGAYGVNEMLGYCYYYSGDPLKAVDYFQRALHGGADSFIARYNLGIIYYQRQDFTRAMEYFQQALNLPEGRVFGYVIGSRVFSQLRVVNKVSPADALLKIHREYGDAKRFIKSCLEKQGKSGELIPMAMRYRDLMNAWAENGGQPSSTELLIY